MIKLQTFCLKQGMDEKGKSVQEDTQPETYRQAATVEQGCVSELL